MTKEFKNNITKCIQLASDIGFLVQAGSCYSLRASSEFKKSARRANVYRELYDAGVTNQDFNLMLGDHSYFQFTENKKDEDVRLVYYPNPYQFIEYLNQKKEALLMLDCGELSQDEYEQVLSEEESSSDIPLIRYDLSIAQHCDKYHPAAHFHIGFHAENRWPVRKILSPFAFFLKILIHYYPQLWFKVGDAGDEEQNTLDLLYREELKKCDVLAEQYFCGNEQERLYFS